MPSFASADDLDPKPERVEELADGVLACTAEGDPNLGAIIGRDGVVAIDARATPTATRSWAMRLREITEKPVRYLVMTHYHAVRALGASAYDADEIVASAETRRLIAERGVEDWSSEFRRMPRLAEDPDSVPGLTWPSLTFDSSTSIHLGDREVRLLDLGRGHTSGDVVVWLPADRVLFAGDLVEAEAACYMGDGHIEEWSTATLDAVAALGAETLVPGRGAVVRGSDVGHAIASTRAFLRATYASVADSVRLGGGLSEAFAAAHEELAPKYGSWPIFEHCLPFNVQRSLDELAGRGPAVWTAETDAELWAAVHG